ncbi:MAG: shikimate kinase [Clostridiales bacterium]|nr:shikimate kinase [Clostridiales bacterium]
MRKSNIVLIGFMGSGKTTFGRKLSSRLHYKFVDMDRYLEKREGRSITEIFALEGEEGFRRIEIEVVKELANRDLTVIATGGGVIKSAENMELLEEKGVVVYLKATPEHIYRNIGQDKSRPLLQGKDKMEKIRSLMKERLSIYEQYGQVTIDVSFGTVSQITDRIIQALEEWI